MKPAAVINQGENFVTLRATTDRPAEIQEALVVRDVQHVYKGDQNQAWDAVLANHCLARAVGADGAEVTCFVHDERLGTADARLARHWRKEGRRYVRTEDYYRGRAGAVWEHQDVSYGLFFTEAVSPEQFATAGVHLHRAAALWEKHSAAALRDTPWLQALATLGVALPGGGVQLSADAATRLGPALDDAGFRAFFGEHPDAALYYAFTKTDGLYGVVPVENTNVSMSSIPAAAPELQAAGQWLLIHASARGAMRLAGSKAHRRNIRGRVRRMETWASTFLSENPDASVADFQAALGEWLTAEIFPADRIRLDRTSHFTRIRRDEVHRFRVPEQTLHFFFDLALRHPHEFTDAYNDALNRVGLGLQRMKYDPPTGHYTPPFFVEFAPGGPGSSSYRYGVEMAGAEATTITLTNSAMGDVVLETDRCIRSAHDFLRALFENLPQTAEVMVVGKAATFSAELQRSPRGLGLPRQGSKYTPMVDHLVGGLRARGVLTQPTGLLIRIGLNTLDRLDAMGEMPLRLPRFLHGALGRTATCREIAMAWRPAASQAHSLLELLGRMCVGQHVHLARLLALNARCEDWGAALASDPHLAELVQRLDRKPEDRALLKELGRDLPPSIAKCLERLTRRREELLAERRALVEAAPRPIRVSPIPAELEAEREQVETQMLLVLAAYIRRLWQRAESLPYLNDRPYTLALYLLFGSDIFYPICRQVEFDVEYLSPCPIRGEGCRV